DAEPPAYRATDSFGNASQSASRTHSAVLRYWPEDNRAVRLQALPVAQIVRDDLRPWRGAIPASAGERSQRHVQWPFYRGYRRTSPRLRMDRLVFRTPGSFG